MAPTSASLDVPIGTTTTLSTSAGCDQVIAQANAPSICVLRFSQVAIHGTLAVSGSMALALVSTDALVIDGTIDVAAHGPTNGPGASTKLGGGFGTASGNGSPAFGNAELTPLTGGSRGNGVSLPVAEGGGGGGGLQLVGCTSVTISGTVSAGGGGGQADYSGGFTPLYPHGGSGGGVLVEGLSVDITGSIFANGGGGGGGISNSTIETAPSPPGGPGSDANLSLVPAAGGTGGPASCWGAAGGGGSGGTETSAPTAGLPGSPDCGDPPGTCGQSCMIGCDVCFSGPGGGAVGRIRINTPSGTIDLSQATASPAPTIGTAVVN